MKEKQKLDIQNYVESELRAKFLKLDNEEKLLMLKHKEEEQKREKARRKRLRDMEKNKREFFQDRRLINEFEEKQRLIEEKDIENHRILFERQVDEKIKQRELLKREEENRIKQEELKMNQDRIAMEEKLKADERKRRIMEKDHERKITVEKQKLDKLLDRQRLKLTNNINQGQSKTNLFGKLRLIGDDPLIRGQIISGENREKNEELKSLADDEFENTNIKMKKYEENKYNEMNKLMSDTDRNKNSRLFLEESGKRNKIINSLNKDGSNENLTESKFKKKIRNEKENEALGNRFIEKLTKSQKELHFLKMQNMNEIEKKQYLQDLGNEYRNAEDFRDTQNIIKESKNIIDIIDLPKHEKKRENVKQKRLIEKKLKDYLSKNKEITPEALKELFPGEEQIYEKVLEVKEKLKKKMRTRKNIKGEEVIEFDTETEDEDSQYNFNNGSSQKINQKGSNNKKRHKTNKGDPNNHNSLEEFNDSNNNFPNNSNYNGDSTNMYNEGDSNSLKYINEINNKHNNYNNNNKHNNYDNNNNKHNNFNNNNNYINEDSSNNYYGNPNSPGLNPYIKQNSALMGSKLKSPSSVLGSPNYNYDNLSNDVNEQSNEHIKEGDNRYNYLNIKPEVFNYNQKFTLKEIQKLTQDYRNKLNLELLKIIREEKNMEEERENLYNQTSDPYEKKKLEKMSSLERTQSSDKILKIKSEIDRKVREYEIKLRENIKK